MMPRRPSGRWAGVLDLGDLTNGQKAILEAVKSGLYSTIVAWGPVRQAKTAGAVLSMQTIGWMHALSNIGNGEYILGSQTIGAIRRNQLTYWRDVSHQLGFHFRDISGQVNMFVLEKDGYEFSRFYLFGGDNEGSAGLAQGATATAAYLDEGTLLVESFLQQIEYRCSYAESFVLITTNTSDPYNIIKTRYLDEADSRTLSIHVPWGDNHHYPRERMEALEREYGGPYYQRMILGLWVPDSGIIYPIMPENLRDMRPNLTGVAVVDVGETGVTAALLFVRLGINQWMVADELIHDGAKRGLMRPETFIGEMKQRWQMAEVVVDPANPDFAARCRQAGLRTIKGDNDVVDGIKTAQACLAQERLLVWSGCQWLLREASAYSWNEKTGKPNKIRDHACDAMRYGCRRLMPAKGTFVHL